MTFGFLLVTGTKFFGLRPFSVGSQLDYGSYRLRELRLVLNVPGPQGELGLVWEDIKGVPRDPTLLPPFSRKPEESSKTTENKL